MRLLTCILNLLLLFGYEAPTNAADGPPYNAFAKRMARAIYRASGRYKLQVYDLNGTTRKPRPRVAKDLGFWQAAVEDAMCVMLAVAPGRTLFSRLEDLLRRVEEAGTVCALQVCASSSSAFCGTPLPEEAPQGKPRLISLSIRLSERFGPPIEIASVAPQRYEAATSSGLRAEACFVTPSGPAGLDCVLFHELLHMKHFLEECTGIKRPALAPPGALPPRQCRAQVYQTLAGIPYSGATRMSPTALMRFMEAFRPEVYECLPELRAGRGKDVWPNLEERRTVGGPDRDGLSENVYRAAQSLEQRYLYPNWPEFFEYAATASAVLAPVGPLSLAYTINPIRKVPDPGQIDGLLTPWSIEAIFRKGQRIWPSGGTASDCAQGDSVVA